MVSNLISSLMAIVMLFEVPLPPKECIREPVKPYIVHEVPHALIPYVCGKPRADGQHGYGLIMACTWMATEENNFGVDVIFMPTKDETWLSEAAWYAVLIHEKGHVNCGAWHA